MASDWLVALDPYSLKLARDGDVEGMTWCNNSGYVVGKGFWQHAWIVKGISVGRSDGIYCVI